MGDDHDEKDMHADALDVLHEIMMNPELAESARANAAVKLAAVTTPRADSEATTVRAAYDAELQGWADTE